MTRPPGRSEFVARAVERLVRAGSGRRRRQHVGCAELAEQPARPVEVIRGLRADGLFHPPACAIVAIHRSAAAHLGDLILGVENT